MRISSLSRGLALAALCAFSSVCFAQEGLTRGGRIGQDGGQGTADQFGRPLTGQIAPGLEPFDAQIPQLLQKYDIPGCVVAVMDNDKLVMTRGYGWASREGKVPISPDSMFRIGALSKPITAVAILLLAQEGKLTLDTPVFNVLKDLVPLEGGTPDPRLSKITIRHLLQHSGGWDAEASFEPFDRLAQIATAAKQPAPPDSDAIIRYMMGQPLQFDPGTKAVYSNFGYLLLGRVIEKISGIGYEDFVNNKLFTPLGAQTFRLGATRKQERDLNEVKYYDYKGAPMAPSLFDPATSAPRPDGSIGLESRGASDGWVCSASDYMRFLSVVDASPVVPDALAPGTLAELARRPAYALTEESYYGLGWKILPLKPYDPKKPNDTDSGVYGSWWHEGALPGTSSFVARDSNGRAWVAFFNSHPQDDKAWSKDMLDALDTAVGQSQWGDPNAQDPNNPEGRTPDGRNLDGRNFNGGNPENGNPDG
ncbi:penicillin-binding protein 4* [Abditibacteriota bacterium]|nr:penicillin-binding protein 4* [Abditibacteriota bacterium]